ncbi:expressed unknown protein [Seminavis robusta]|uniref:Uncharacterized protein n=1 Tax=Seminavis robusta TaxID=568900 RepID=A0A9N8D474_9STRA|nr:expressed unknown protein [Seminavis robusta]|eukprot:Sro1_g000900.1 n/a (242) ;mRNA; f:270814-271539
MDALPKVNLVQGCQHVAGVFITFGMFVILYLVVVNVEMFSIKVSRFLQRRQRRDQGEPKDNSSGEEATDATAIELASAQATIVLLKEEIQLLRQQKNAIASKDEEIASLKNQVQQLEEEKGQLMAAAERIESLQKQRSNHQGEASAMNELLRANEQIGSLQTQLQEVTKAMSEELTSMKHKQGDLIAVAGRVVEASELLISPFMDASSAEVDLSLLDGRIRSLQSELDNWIDTVICTMESP